MGIQQLKAEAIKLSPQERLELITAIVESLQNSIPQSDRSAAVERMRGLLVTDRPAPTDAEVTAMLEERLTQRYSS